MPAYRVTDTVTGKKYKLTGDSAPTEQELNQNFNSSTKTPELPYTPWTERTTGGLAKNAVRSLGSNVKDVASAAANVFNPDLQKNTVANIGRLGAGAVELAIPGEQGHEEYARSVGRIYKDRYGGPDKAANTLYQDPVGTLLDASVVLGGAGAAAKLGSKGAQIAGKAGTASKLARAGSTLGNVSSAVDPIQQLAKAVPVGRAVPKLGEKIEQAGREFSLRGLRPSSSQQASFLRDTGKIVEDFIAKNKLYGTGTEKVDEIIRPLQEAFDEATIRSGKVVPIKKIAGRFDEAIEKLTSGAQARDPQNRTLAAFLAEERDLFLKDLSSKKQVGIDYLTQARRSIDENTPMKQFQPGEWGKQRALGDIYRKTINEVSGTTDTGRKLRDLYTFRKIAEKQAGLGKATKPVTFTKLGSAGVGGVVGGFPGAVAGYLAEQLINNPTTIGMASRLAQGVGKSISNVKLPSIPAYTFSKVSSRVRKE